VDLGKFLSKFQKRKLLLGRREQDLAAASECRIFFTFGVHRILYKYLYLQCSTRCMNKERNTASVFGVFVARFRHWDLHDASELAKIAVLLPKENDGFRASDMVEIYSMYYN
jgi:hypothetical protein